MGYRETMTSTIATVVILRARSKVPIHGTQNISLHPMDDNEYLQRKDEWHVGASSGSWTRVCRLKGETCNHTSIAAPCLSEKLFRISQLNIHVSVFMEMVFCFVHFKNKNTNHVCQQVVVNSVTMARLTAVTLSCLSSSTRHEIIRGVGDTWCVHRW